MRINVAPAEPKDWDEEIQEAIYRLYVVEDKPLSEVRTKVEEQFHFQATYVITPAVSTYERRNTSSSIELIQSSSSLSRELNADYYL